MLLLIRNHPAALTAVINLKHRCLLHPWILILHRCSQHFRAWIPVSCSKWWIRLCRCFLCNKALLCGWKQIKYICQGIWGDSVLKINAALVLALITVMIFVCFLSEVSLCAYAAGNITSLNMFNYIDSGNVSTQNVQSQKTTSQKVQSTKVPSQKIKSQREQSQRIQPQLKSYPDATK